MYKHLHLEGQSTGLMLDWYDSEEVLAVAVAFRFSHLL